MSRTGFIDIGDPDAPVGSQPWCKYAHGVLCTQRRNTHSEVSRLKYSLLAFRRDARWKQLTDRIGTVFRSWEDYVAHPEPEGLGWDVNVADAVMTERDDSRLLGDIPGACGDRIIEAAEATTGEVLPKHAHPDAQIAHQTQPKRAREGGVSRRTQQKLDALARKAPELLEAVRAGRMSTHKACITAGIEKPRRKHCPNCGHEW